MSNNYLKSGNQTGYQIRNKQGIVSTRKFINDLDYSLDLLKIREVYEKVYRRTDFGFWDKGKEYCQHVINLTFLYAVKEYNQVRKNVYLKSGYNYFEIQDKIDDCLYFDGDELVAVKIGEHVNNPVTKNKLGKYFWLEDGKYRAKQNIKVVKSVSNIRDDIYVNGFYCDGVKYVRWKRSSGASRNGRCLFINERLYKRIHQWEKCGLNVNEGAKIDLAAWEPYIALTLSSIIGFCEIHPENFLLIDDWQSVFDEEMIAVTEDVDGWLQAEEKTTTQRNSIWDGQSLMDVSLFGEYANYGSLLLRNRFFKSCCFNTSIQQYFKDNNITDIAQLNGRTLATDISDIKIITTPSSIKHLKFGDFEQWLTIVEPMFGIVKHEKPTHYFSGRMVQSHYQLLNTIQLSYSDTEKLLQPSLDYLHKLKTDPAVLRYHIKYPENEDFSLPLTSIESKNDVIYKLMDINEDFTKTKLYASFRNDLTRSFSSNLKCGHVLLEGNYSTLLGNPMEMLRHSIGRFDGTSVLGVGEIHSLKFNYDKIILGSRSPHVTMGNVLLAKNVSCPIIDEYFNLTEEIVCINAIGDNILERLSGADYDSDALVLCDNSILIENAQRNYGIFKVPTNLVSTKKISRKYTNLEKSKMDHATGENLIGEIINLSQDLNTMIWDIMNNGGTYDEIKEIYYDVSKLDILSNIEIDKAKKVYTVNSKREISKIRNKYKLTDKDGKAIKPQFFSHIMKKKGFYVPGKKRYRYHESTMDHLHKIVKQESRKGRNQNLILFSEILNEEPYQERYVNFDSVDRVVLFIRQYKNKLSAIWSNNDLEPCVKHSLSDELRQDCVNYINSLKFGYSTMYYLLHLVDMKEYSSIRNTIINILFGTPNKEFFKVLKKSASDIPYIVEVIGNNWDTRLYNMKFSRQNLKRA